MSALPAGVEWIASEEGGVRIGRCTEGTVVEWSGIGRLVVPGARGVASFLPEDGVVNRALQKFRATQLLACRRYLEGRVSLHAAAVAWPHGAVVLVGESGAGKSTTAMELVERTGAGFVADDVVPLEITDGAIVAESVDDSFWLSSDARAFFGVADSTAAKVPVVPRRRAERHAPVRLLVQVVFDETALEPTLTAVEGQESFVVLSRSR